MGVDRKETNGHAVRCPAIALHHATNFAQLRLGADRRIASKNPPGAAPPNDEKEKLHEADRARFHHAMSAGTCGT